MKFALPKVHPSYETLLGEVHSRPFPTLQCPTSVVQLTLLQGWLSKSAEADHLERLCKELECTPVSHSTRSFRAQIGHLEVRMQRHLEFSIYQFIRTTGGSPFSESPLEMLPPGWLEGLSGELISAVWLEAEPYGKDQTTTPERLHQLLGEESPKGSLVRSGKTMVWSNFLPDENGFVRYLVQNKTLGSAQLGRLVQRLLEAETYRLLSLLALPMLKDIGPMLDRMEYSMLLISDHIQRINSIDDQKSLLAKLSAQAAEVELLRSNDYRFSASHAYFDLYDERLGELKEEKMEGILTFGEFLNRRMGPARRTMRHSQQRLADLSSRIGSARELLQTNINMTIEHQNQELLLSMEKRSHLQLRMQEAVEGLSIAAISYYMVSLVKYVLEGLKTIGVPLNKEMATGLAVPLVLLTVWLAIHKIKDHVLGSEEEEH